MKRQHTDGLDIQWLQTQRDSLELDQDRANVQSHNDKAEQQESEIDQVLRASQIEQTNSQIKELTILLTDAPQLTETGIVLGHVVTIRINTEEPASYLLVSHGGGQELPGKVTLSCETPVGQALIGKAVGDKFQILSEEDYLEIEIMDIRPIA